MFKGSVRSYRYKLIIEHSQVAEPVYQRHEYLSNDLNVLRNILPAYPGMDYSIWQDTEPVLLDCSIVPQLHK